MRKLDSVRDARNSRPTRGMDGGRLTGGRTPAGAGARRRRTARLVRSVAGGSFAGGPQLRALLALVVGVVATAQVARGLDLYVASDGNDAWSGGPAAANEGKTDGPFATLVRARDEIRRRRQAGTVGDEPAVVHVRAGMYRLEKALDLDARDSGTEQAPVTWRAYKDEKVRIIGGREVTGFAPVTDPAILERLDESARGKVMQADLKALGVADFGDAVEPCRRIELFFDDEPMRLARWPNEGYVKVVDVVGGQPMEIHGLKGDKVGRFTYDGDRPKRWLKENDVRLLGYWFWDWSDAYQKVESVDAEKRVIATVPPYHHYGYRKGQRWCAMNLLSEIDSPGEWYLDRPEGMLYFWPPSPIGTARAFVSVTDTLISTKDASHVTIRGFCVEYSRSHAIVVAGGSKVLVADCTLRNLGGRAVIVNGGTGHGVTGCDIYNTGDGGVSLEGGDRKALTPGGHFATDNHIYRYSRAGLCYRTAVSTSGVGNRIANNLIHDAPHMGLGLSGNEHVIELNEVHHVCMETDDAGAFYMGRDWTWRGNIIRHNYFHHIGQFKSHVGVQSVYLDDWTSGTTVQGNICYRGGRGVLVGGGRNNTVENNIFIECTPSVHVDSRGLGWAKYYFDGKENTLIQRLNEIPYRQPPWSTRYPELLTLYEDEPALAKYNRVVRNISVGGRWLDLQDGLTDKVVEVKDNLVDKDPGFVDAAHGDFRLRDDSPAYKLGFQRIPVEKIGLTRNGLRVSTVSWEPSELGQTAVVEMKNAPYPHASRADGFKNGGKQYPREPHYVDGSVALFVPRGFRAGERTDLLLYFHGHLNNVRRAMAEFRLREQVVASGRNVILVFPEGPKDVPDSGGGKLEEKDGLKRLVDEVLDVLVAERKIPGRSLGRVVLAGHSGAYRVISFCLEHGGLEENVTDVGLLDASYARLDAFVDWVARKRDGRLFSIFTDHLSGENVYMMTHLRKRGVSYELRDEDDVGDDTLRAARVLFVNTTKLSHNETVRWLERWLRSGTPSTEYQGKR